MGGRGWNGIGKNIPNISVYSHNNYISHNMTYLNKNYTVFSPLKRFKINKVTLLWESMIGNLNYTNMILKIILFFFTNCCFSMMLSIRSILQHISQQKIVESTFKGLIHPKMKKHICH